ncbi:MAG: N-acetyl sugar amidotransferase [Candidatus Omnitrophica bacterium]|nr:N-acetyl sugar amidotransferase [Candidatus Omnitrophota bacterium]
MRYCLRCLYPENARPTILFDDQGICSGCRHHEARHRINWKEREATLARLLAEYKERSRAAGHIYDCLVPVSGGKDSHFQVHLIKRVYGLNPLCVTFNHTFNTSLGLRNLNNLVEQFNVDLLRFTANPESVRKIARYMVKKVGDLTWHYHAGIMTVPFQVSVKYQIPLIIWPEHYGELTGVFTLDDMVEFTKWVRQEHDMRGIEPEDIVKDPASGITWQDLYPYIYPTDEEIEQVGVRGIFLTNYIYWDAKAQAELVISRYKFQPLTRRRDRTFSLYSKTDDHANEVHDYMKYLKFGYGRATDDASTEIRYGRMTREEGIEMVRRYDAARPRTLDVYLKFLGMTEEEFEGCVEPMRDLSIWDRGPGGRWRVKDTVWNHANGPEVEQARVPQVADRTLSPTNRRLYWSDGTAAEAPDEVEPIVTVTKAAEPNRDHERFNLL